MFSRVRQFIDFSVEAFFEDAPLSDQERRIVSQGAGKKRGQVT